MNKQEKFADDIYQEYSKTLQSNKIEDYKNIENMCISLFCISSDYPQKYQNSQSDQFIFKVLSNSLRKIRMNSLSDWQTQDYINQISRFVYYTTCANSPQENINDVNPNKIKFLKSGMDKDILFRNLCDLLKKCHNYYRYEDQSNPEKINYLWKAMGNLAKIKLSYAKRTFNQIYKYYLSHRKNGDTSFLAALSGCAQSDPEMSITVFKFIDKYLSSNLHFVPKSYYAELCNLSKTIVETNNKIAPNVFGFWQKIYQSAQKEAPEKLEEIISYASVFIDINNSLTKELYDTLIKNNPKNRFHIYLNTNRILPNLVRAYPSIVENVSYPQKNISNDGEKIIPDFVYRTKMNINVFQSKTEIDNYIKDIYNLCKYSCEYIGHYIYENKDDSSAENSKFLDLHYQKNLYKTFLNIAKVSPRHIPEISEILISEIKENENNKKYVLAYSYGFIKNLMLSDEAQPQAEILSSKNTKYLKELFCTALQSDNNAYNNKYSDYDEALFILALMNDNPEKYDVQDGSIPLDKLMETYVKNIPEEIPVLNTERIYFDNNKDAELVYNVLEKMKDMNYKQDEQGEEKIFAPEKLSKLCRNFFYELPDETAEQYEDIFEEKRYIEPHDPWEIINEIKNFQNSDRDD